MIKYVIVSLVGGLLFGVMDGLINTNPWAARLLDAYKPFAKSSINAPADMVIDRASMSVEHYREMTKEQLLAEMARIDSEMFTYLTSETFDSNRRVTVFWGGETNAVDVLYFLRDHDILHIGWHLALMDHLRIPRFEFLVQYWGP